jgi:hypothetical protein
MKQRPQVRGSGIMTAPPFYEGSDYVDRNWEDDRAVLLGMISDGVQETVANVGVAR